MKRIKSLSRKIRITANLLLRHQLIWTLKRKFRNRLFPYGADINHVLVQNRVPNSSLQNDFPGDRLATEVAVIIPEACRNELWSQNLTRMVTDVSGVSLETDFGDPRWASVVWISGPVELSRGFFVSESVDVPNGFAGTYFDGLATTRSGVRPVFRPEFSRTLLRAAQYLGPLVVLSADMARRHMEEFDVPKVFSLEGYIEWSLRHHVPWLKVKGRPYRHLGVEEAWTDMRVLTTSTCRTSKEVTVAVVIPSRSPELLRRCLKSVQTSGMQAVGVYVVANGHQREAVAEVAESSLTNARVLRFLESFNWARVNNWAASYAKEDILLFLNDDVEFVDNGWLTKIQCALSRDEVGVVGGKLLYPTGEIQHAGLCSPRPGVWVHKFQFLEQGDAGYMGLLELPQEVSAVTGAMFATRYDTFREIGGFNEKYPLAYNDVDFCLRIRMAGREVIYNPGLVGIHWESASRPREVEEESQEEFLLDWGNYIDPFFPRGMTRFYGFPRLNDVGLDL